MPKCDHCGSIFIRERSTKRFCSDACKLAFHRKKKKPEKPRVAKAKKRPPDEVAPSEPTEEKGEVGKSLDEQSQEVCPNAAEKTQELADNEQA